MDKSVLRKALPIIGGLFVVAFAIAPFLVGAYDLNLLGRFLALGLTAIGLALLWGHGGILSLGQGVFFGLGGYALAMHLKLVGLYGGDTMPDFMVWTGLKALPAFWEPFKNPVFALAAVVLLPGIVAASFGWLVFRRRIGGVYFALITQALALAFATLLISQQAYTGGFNGLTNYSTLLGFRLSNPDVSRALYWITLLIVIGALFGCHFLLTSRFGQLLRATRDGANRVRFLGYSPTPYQVIAFTVAAVLSGLSGALFTLHSGVISPALVGVVPSIEMVIWAAIGGRTSIIGALAGALLVNFAKDRVSTAFPEFWLYLLGASFIMVVTLAPQGLAGMFSGLNLSPKPKAPKTKPAPAPSEAPAQAAE
ncbi:MAG: urea ABC transporter permease subunit UrtC [Alphaproteobacteria bacterium]